MSRGRASWDDDGGRTPQETFDQARVLVERLWIQTILDELPEKDYYFVEGMRNLIDTTYGDSGEIPRISPRQLYYLRDLEERWG